MKFLSQLKLSCCKPSRPPADRFARWSTAKRIKRAQEITQRLTDQVGEAVALNENNRIILFTDVLSSQIPQSLAANAFNLFTHVMRNYEIIRLCTIWDKSAENTESIVTVIDLIDNEQVIEQLALEAYQHHVDQEVHHLNPSSDPELRQAEEEIIAQSRVSFAERRQQQIRQNLLEVRKRFKKVASSPRLRAVKFFRNHYLAHSLTVTTDNPPSFDTRDIVWLLDESIGIIEELYSNVNGVGYDINEDVREIHRQYAEALWHHCQFDIESPEERRERVRQEVVANRNSNN